MKNKYLKVVEDVKTKIEICDKQKDIKGVIDFLVIICFRNGGFFKIPYSWPSVAMLKSIFGQWF